MAFSVSYTYLIIDKYSKKLAAIDRKTRRFTQRVAEAVEAVRPLNRGLGRMQRKLIGTSRGFTLASQTANGFKNQTERAGYSAAAFSKNMNQVATKLDKVARKEKVVITRTQRLTRGFQKLSASASGIQGMLSGAVVGLAALFPVTKALKFSAVMTDVKKVMNNITPEQFVQLKRDILNTSVALGRLPVQMAAVAVEGGKVGVTAVGMKDFMGAVARTSVSFDILEGTAAANLASIKNRLKLTTVGTEYLMDAVNHLADNTSAGGARMVEIISRLSGTMSAIKMPSRFIAGWAGFADQISVSARLGASGFRQMVTRMKLMPGMMEKIIADPHKTIVRYLRQYEKLDPAKRAILLLKKFGPEAGVFAEAAVNNMGLLDEAIGKVSDETLFMGSMMRELRKKMESPEFKLKQISSAMLGLAIVIGDSVLPVIQVVSPHIVRMGTAIRKFAEAHPKLMAWGLAAMFAFAAVSALVVGLGILAASVTAMVGSGAAMAMIFGVVGSTVAAVAAAIGATAAAIGAPFLVAYAAIMAVSAAINQLRANWDTLVAPGFLKDLAGFLGEGVSKVVTGIKATVAGPESPAASMSATREAVVAGALNGRIEVVASGGAAVRKAELSTSLPGNLGFNMAGAGG